MAGSPALRLLGGVRFRFLGVVRITAGAWPVWLARPKTVLPAIHSGLTALEPDGSDFEDDSGSDMRADYRYRLHETEAGWPGGGKRTKRILSFDILRSVEFPDCGNSSAVRRFASRPPDVHPGARFVAPVEWLLAKRTRKWMEGPSFLRWEPLPLLRPRTSTHLSQPALRRESQASIDR